MDAVCFLFRKKMASEEVALNSMRIQAVAFRPEMSPQRQVMHGGRRHQPIEAHERMTQPTLIVLTAQVHRTPRIRFEHTSTPFAAPNNHETPSTNNEKEHDPASSQSLGLFFLFF